jgi:acetyltransferase EpsM
MAALAGNVTVGEGTQIGINATVKQGITIGKWAIIGAGAVIVKDVPDFAVVVGNPGRIIKYTSSN